VPASASAYGAVPVRCSFCAYEEVFPATTTGARRQPRGRPAGLEGERPDRDVPQLRTPPVGGSRRSVR
jgi:hypothetical protein